MKKKRVGIMGGTFDPIHIGHLVIAELVRDEFSLDKVVFIPAAEPPHKLNQKVTRAEHRYVMTEMAIASNPHFEISDIEMRRTGPSYTINTMTELVKDFGDDNDFYFIVGADSILDLPNWDRVDDLLNLCHFVGTSRPGCIVDMEKMKAELGEIAGEKIHIIETPELEISSTDIRRRLSKGTSIKYIVPAEVEEYIYKNKLYI